MSNTAGRQNVLTPQHAYCDKAICSGNRHICPKGYLETSIHFQVAFSIPASVGCAIIATPQPPADRPLCNPFPLSSTPSNSTP